MEKTIEKNGIRKEIGELGGALESAVRKDSVREEWRSLMKEGYYLRAAKIAKDYGLRELELTSANWAYEKVMDYADRGFEIREGDSGPDNFKWYMVVKAESPKSGYGRAADIAKMHDLGREKELVAENRGSRQSKPRQAWDNNPWDARYWTSEGQL